jgi:two-component system response regulator HupR/HoxA
LAATSRDLAKEVEAGRFRPELYYRLAGLAVQVPALRERPDDIPLLTRHFLAEYGQRTGRGPIPIEPQVTVALQQYTWPGNVRQLRNEVERMAALADEGEAIPLSLLSPEIRSARPVAATRRGGESLTEALDRIKRTLIEEALVGCTGNRSRAADRLGISRPNLQKMMRRLGIR